MLVHIDADELGELRRENARLSEQVDSLQAVNTRVVEQLRRASIRTHVAQFHHIFGFPVLHTPQDPSEEVLRRRLRLITREYLEVLEAAFDTDGNPHWAAFKSTIMRVVEEAPIDFDLVAFIHELGDLDWCVEGTRLECGVQGVPVMLELARANLEKEGGEVLPDFTIVKPPGWRKADIKRVLEEQMR